MRQIYKLSEKVAEFGEDQQRIISETLLPAKYCIRLIISYSSIMHIAHFINKKNKKLVIMIHNNSF